VRRIENRQHASWLPSGLGRSSCEGIVHYVGYWPRRRVLPARQQAESVKTSDPGQTPKVLQVLFPRDVIEVDPPNHISN